MRASSGGLVAVRLAENRFIRAAPGVDGAVLGVVRRGRTLPCAAVADPRGWRRALYRGRWGWVNLGNSPLDSPAPSVYNRDRSKTRRTMSDEAAAAAGDDDQGAGV